VLHIKRCVVGFGNSSMLLRFASSMSMFLFRYFHTAPYVLHIYHTSNELLQVGLDCNIK